MAKINFSKVEEIQGTIVEETVGTETNTNKEEMVEMTTNKIAGINGVIVEATKEEFVTFCMEAPEITVAVLEGELDKVSAKYRKKDRKEVKAGLLYDAVIVEEEPVAEKEEKQWVVEPKVQIEEKEVIVVEDEPAIDESSVAEENKPEEEVDMNKQVKEEIKKAVLKGNQRALDKSRIAGGVDPVKDIMKKDREVLDFSRDGYRSYVEEAKNRILADLPFSEVLVNDIEFLRSPRKYDNYSVVGTVEILVPENTLQVAWKEEVDGKWGVTWLDFVDYAWTQGRDQFNPRESEYTEYGTLKLQLRESKDKGLYVSLPMVQSKKDAGQFFDVFRVMNPRFGFANSKNNGDFSASVTAYLQAIYGEYVQENPINRVDFQPSCGNCRYAVKLYTHDGIEDYRKNSVSQQTTSDLGLYGNRTPRIICTLHKEYMDMKRVEEINEAEGADRAGFMYDVVVTNEHGEEVIEQRYLGRDEVWLDGRAQKLNAVLSASTEEVARGCVNYHNNAPKSEKQVTLERIEAIENGADADKVYVDQFFTTRGKVGRIAVQTMKANGEWVNAFPGDVEDAQDIRVMGVGNIIVKGTDAVSDLADYDFTPEMEEVREEEVDAKRMVRYIYQVAYRLWTYSKEVIAQVRSVAKATPEGLNDVMKAKWEKAAKTLEEQYVRYLEMEKLRDQFEEFGPMFFAEHVQGTLSVDPRSLMANTHFRVLEGDTSILGETGNMTYKEEGMLAREFAKYMDELEAEVIIMNVLATGRAVSITQFDGGVDPIYLDALLGFMEEEEDLLENKLVAEGLQYLLQRELNGFIYRLRRMDKTEAAKEIMGFGIHEAFKVYLFKNVIA